MNSDWIECSATEKMLAISVAEHLSNGGYDNDFLCGVLEKLAFKISREAYVVPRRFNKIINGLCDQFPNLNKIEPDKPFPTANGDLTANFFGRLAQEIAANETQPSVHGVVSTPHVLAGEMVALSASIWLSHQLAIDIPTLMMILNGEISADKVTHSNISSLLVKARWYDPCIGGGVFPVAILQLLTRFGVSLNEKSISQITGCDIQPLFITATNIRIALASNSEFREYFLAKDSLTSFSEQSPLELTQPNARSLGCDIVVGNPPYVRADKLDPGTKSALRELYPSIAGGSVDLYNYFIAHGLQALKPGGVLCYVSPAGFQRSKSGKSTRQFISREGCLQAIFDFDELSVFGSVGVHASVYAISKSRPQGSTYSYLFNDLQPQYPLSYGLRRSTQIPESNIGADSWHLGDPQTGTILRHLAGNSVPLREYAGQIYSGIKTGFKGIYEVSRHRAESLAADDETRDFIKPMLRPSSIRAWSNDWDGTHMLLVKKGELIPEASSLMEHFREYESTLRKRSDVQNHPTWYGLRACSYYHVFDEQKIIFPDISHDCRFSMDTTGFFFPDGAFMIPTSDYFLLGILNSCIGRFYFRARCNSIGNPNRRGRLRFKKTYVEEFPVIKHDATNASERIEIAELAESISSQSEDPDVMLLNLDKIDKLALQIYQIPDSFKASLLDGHIS